jgi:radical SAM-linked protein
MPKYLLLFEKGESVRWLGHLDILRTFERAIRRAGLPIAFSQGFNPRERLAFASALSTGVTGAAERATLELTEPQQTDQIVAQLNAALPPGYYFTNQVLP